MLRKKLMAIWNVTVVTACLIGWNCWTSLVTCCLLVVVSSRGYYRRVGITRQKDSSWNVGGSSCGIEEGWRIRMGWLLWPYMGNQQFRMDVGLGLGGTVAQWRRPHYTGARSCGRLSSTIFLKTLLLRDWKWAARLRWWVLTLLRASNL